MAHAGPTVLLRRWPIASRLPARAVPQTSKSVCSTCCIAVRFVVHDSVVAQTHTLGLLSCFHDLKVRVLLYAGDAGSCYGGDVVGPFQWMQANPIAYETSNPYIACSSDSGTEGFCQNVAYGCTALNTARTCSTFTASGGACVGLSVFPNATLSNYGEISGDASLQAEILANGPISCGIDAQPLLTYTSGIINVPGGGIDHVISVVGWGNDAAAGPYWIVRNSWGSYWGEFGYVRVAFGALNVGDDCAFGIIGSYTAPEVLAWPVSVEEVMETNGLIA